jgi:hypothetical protein
MLPFRPIKRQYKLVHGISGANVDNRTYIANIGTTTVSGGGTRN